MTRRLGAAALLLALVAGAGGCGAESAEPGADTSASGATQGLDATDLEPEDRNTDPTDAETSPTGPTGSTGPAGRARTGAAGRVSQAVILEQLRQTAERIAQRMPSAEPTLLPTDVDPDTNRGLGYRLMLDFGFDRTQWQYLDALWHRESGWNHLAENPSSGAYGIPQSLPATKMAVVGDDYRTNPETQIRWGLAYIAARYGNPQGAWAHSERVGWY